MLAMSGCPEGRDPSSWAVCDAAGTTAAEIALRENIPLIPVRQTFLCNHRLSELIAADGIHLTMPGYERLFDTLADWVKKNI